MPDEEEIQAQIDLAQLSIAEGKSRWPGMTYEQGVRSALEWVTEADDVPPMGEDDD